MISEQNKSIAHWTMEYALKNGCQASRVSVVTGTNNTFEYRNTQLDKLQQSTENKLFIELFVDGRYGTFSTNRIDKSELEDFVKNGIASVKYLAPDPFRQLPPVERYFVSDGEEDLDLYDETFSSIRTEDKLTLVEQATKEIYGRDDRIISVSSAYDDGVGEEYMVSSNGFEGETSDSAFNMTVEVSLKTGGSARAEAFWYDSSGYWNDLVKSGIGEKAFERALRKIGQEKIKSGKYDMILDNTVSARVFSPIISALYGSALQQKNSFLLDRLGEKITSDCFSVMDMPYTKRTFGARYYDGEGVATEERPIIESGVLKTYYIDTYNSLKMNVAPTISSPSVIVAQKGMRNFDQMLSAMTTGIWVTGFNGGNTNPTTGDYSFGVEGFLIENGLPVRPLNEMNITGNMLTLWQNLVEVGNDPRRNSSSKIPTLLFGEINFSGA